MLPPKPQGADQGLCIFLSGERSRCSNTSFILEGTSRHAPVPPAKPSPMWPAPASPPWEHVLSPRPPVKLPFLACGVSVLRSMGEVCTALLDFLPARPLPGNAGGGHTARRITG